MDEKKLTDFVLKLIANAMRFSQRKLGDTPTDDQQLTPRGYVNMYGSITGRPSSSVAGFGQQYFSTDNGYPIFFTTNKNWVNGAGSVVASN